MTAFLARRITMRMADMNEAKWVRIMCDYAADPVWGPDGIMDFLDELPVTADLRASLRAWEDDYDAQDPGVSSPPFDLSEFSQRGRELAREVKRQLPDWTVMYFDEQAHSEAAQDTPRERFEYVIEL